MAISSEIAGAIEEQENMFDQEFDTTIDHIPKVTNVDLTLSQRMMSACAGSFLTSLVVTPFDVVRIRLQQQELLYPVQTQDVTCCRKVFWELPTEKIVGSLKGNFCNTDSCLHDNGKINGTIEGLVKIGSKEGVCTLYRGLGMTLLMSIPSNVVYFSGYEFLRDSSPLKQSYPVLNPLLCGSLSRIIAATTIAPLELIKTRIQAVPTGTNSTSSSIFRMVIQRSLQELRKSGISSIYRGLSLTLMRDVPFSGIYWSSYEYITHLLRSYSSLSDESQFVNTDTALFLRSFIGGSSAGIIAALFTNPFDVGKTRKQVSFEESNHLGTLGKNNQQNESIFKFITKIYKNEGLGALYVGITPRCMKIAPACAIMISSYEMSKKIFKDYTI